MNLLKCLPKITTEQDSHIVNIKKGENAMDTITLLDKEILVATGLLNGIFAECITEKEYKIINPELTRFFEENTRDAAKAAESFNMHLAYVLCLLMDGVAEE